ncbi:hydrophobin [Crepidotus variabilis]|uniref:Hydrophobin n=1 Tax=Crepidotus variabilis TaxID=179855 RepID=A0A9P6JWB2_9AGAR|nr:hydrophobin [Crepidotus variabilis]
MSCSQDARGYKGTCNSGNLACCNQYHASNSPTVQSFSGLFGLGGKAFQDISLAMQCNPIPIIGGAMTKCEQKTVCCENNNSNTLINVSCTPVSVL